MWNAVPSPTSMRILAPVLTPVPGIDVSRFERGWAPSRDLMVAASSLCWSSSAVRFVASLGTMTAAASVPGTATVCEDDPDHVPDAPPDWA
ncbi:hypothetical protein SAMN05442782_6303 [Streptomyces sp. OK228]|nr:hypothetical protein SAMN05442782_6303 [Streptomyces sp. OK228]